MSKLKSYRIGERSINRQGLTMEIVGYKNNKEVEIEFLETGERKVVRYINFKRRAVWANLAEYPYLGEMKLKPAAYWATAVSVILIMTAILTIWTIFFR